jgi:hypothetical protein
LHRLFPILIASALSACGSDGIVVTREQAIVPDVEIHLRYLGTLGTVPTTVLANPFPQDKDSEAVVRVLSDTPVRPHLRYSAAPPVSSPTGYRMVVAFGTWPVGGDSYCRNPSLAPLPAPVDTTATHIVLCLGTVTLAESAAHTRRIAAPDDPRLARLLNDLLVALMLSPQRNNLESPAS